MMAGGAAMMVGGIPLTWLDQALDSTAIAIVGVEWFNPLPGESDDAPPAAEDAPTCT